MISIFFDYFLWWYSAGLARLFKYFKAFILILADAFSVRVLAATFFEPWKRDTTPTRGLSLDRRFMVWIANLIAIFFGMFIKGIAFLIFLACFLILLAIEVLVFLIWFFYPAIIIGGIVWIVKNLSIF